MSIEEADGKHGTYKEESHYDAIAPKFSTSIPQIKREFTAMFTNGVAYLNNAARKYDQPKHYARKIMLYSNIYEAQILDQLIGVVIKRDTLGVNDFKDILKEYNSGALVLDESSKCNTSIKDKGQFNDNDPDLLRDCSYYEENV